jgi:phenylpropionate dioxygenase-like ring-hydroxylating dioxygenase large terminal subunit
VPNKGSFFKFSFGGEEILVVRGDGESVYANLNICRHRGVRICAEETGKVRSFVCSVSPLALRPRRKAP